jgi:mRNA interferase RelE/StbE
MEPYNIEFSPEADRFLDNADVKTSLRIVTAIKKLAKSPRPPGCKKIKGSDADYRIRIGDYRVVYEVKKKVLLI